MEAGAGELVKGTVSSVRTGRILFKLKFFSEI